MNQIILAHDRDIALARKSIAVDLTPAEFDHFLHMCRHSGLDPLRKQIYAIVVNKDKPDKRRVTYVTAIDGYRTIADRTQSYRPGQRSTEVSKDDRDPITNPQGIISATASVWKHVQGEWHEFSETVYWEEFAPLREIWAFNKDIGRKAPTGKFELDRSGQWGKMGRVMLQKCAEAQALRRGWPDELSGLYISEEVDKERMIDITPSEQAERADVEERQAKLGGPTVLVDWMDSKPLAAIPANDFHGMARDFIKRNAEEPTKVAEFAERNRASLREFWKLKPDEALDLKKAFETYANTARQMEGAG